ncbi:MAG TPA: PAS domain S-box protein, partial [Dehalococcoidia bacterium]|nr:PAS domain S-box protein [Dehalococcoidia bacterium]
VTERRKTEEALRNSEQRYRLLAENVSDVIWVTDMNLRPTYFSPSVTRLLGRTVEEAMAGSMETALTPHSIETASQLFADAVAREKEKTRAASGVPTVELEFKRKDGSTVWADTTVSFVRDSDGHPTAILGVLHDITKRKMAEEALKASEQRFKTIFEESPIASTVHDSVGRLTDMNRASLGLYGLSSPGEAKGPALFDDPGLPDSAKQALRCGKVWRYEGPFDFDRAVKAGLYNTTKSGRAWLRLVMAALGRNQSGEPSGYVCLTEDITERRRMEEALRTSEERFRNLVETTTDWVWEVNAAGICTFSSHRIRDILGYEPEEVVGKTPTDFLPADEVSRLTSLLAPPVVQPERAALFDVAFLHKDGRRVVVETSAVPFFNADGAVVGYRGIARDITEREDMKRQLQQGLRKLEGTMDRTIQAISQIVETRDCFTAGHQRRTSQLSCAIAQGMGLPAEQVQVVRIAALLHDLGKIAVPTEVLSKPGRLSEIEFSMIKTHCQVGYDILKTVDFPWPIADIVRQHHERLDGSGYPYGLRDKDIVLEARILGVADVVEAMTSHRPYRPALGIEKALEEISRNSGRLYDADTVQACLELFNVKGFAFENTGLSSEWPAV